MVAAELALVVAAAVAPAAAPPDAAVAPAVAGAPGGGYVAEVEAWRRQREARLRAPDGWLHPGANRFGGAPDDEVRLPASVPPHAGTLTLGARQSVGRAGPGTGGAAGSGGPGGVPAVTVTLAPGSSATLNGRAWPGGAGGPVPLAVDRDDAGAPPDIVGFGAVTLQVIERGGRLGARIKDPASPARQRFTGLTWFPIAPELRVIARLAPHAGGPREIVVPDASGGKQRLRSPGRLAFTLSGRALSLDPVLDGPDEGDLLVVFRDATSGRESYGAGRFVRAKRQPDGAYVIDFNRAYSPPCAFTPYATCPLPPAANRIPLAVAGGERAPPESVHRGDGR
jgi:uncharacterized protein (DUF1684 family)